MNAYTHIYTTGMRGAQIQKIYGYVVCILEATLTHSASILCTFKHTVYVCACMCFPVSLPYFSFIIGQ